MPSQDWEQLLRDLPRIATPVRRRPDRETWRLAVGDKAYFLHFYPARGGRLSRSPATREFAALKTLQTLGLDALRPLALLSGLRFGERKGDGLLTAAIEAAVRLDVLDPADHVAARDGVIAWLEKLRDAGLGHDDLRPSSFLFVGGRVLLTDAVGLSRRRLSREQLMRFAHAGGDSISRGDRVRAWRTLVPEGDAPPPDKRIRTR